MWVSGGGGCGYKSTSLHALFSFLFSFSINHLRHSNISAIQLPETVRAYQHTHTETTCPNNTLTHRIESTTHHHTTTPPTHTLYHQPPSPSHFPPFTTHTRPPLIATHKKMALHYVQCEKCFKDTPEGASRSCPHCGHVFCGGCMRVEIPD